ncbi:PAS domain-containing sensor histidine kinase [Hydrogenophaga sp. 2FB]|uniref:hybrid sensor histidine kinase/response regulator n=1 Tax=Hydrogenophaga sp. 2FB TaxID=2502187 RepID=UPI001485430C|nr:PAS domain-containing sensor histidine kinase [Hydrogenophaga sp. 2FB]
MPKLDRPDEIQSPGESSCQKMVANMPGALLQYAVGPDGKFECRWRSPGCLELWEVHADAFENDACALWDTMEPKDIQLMRAALKTAANTVSDWTQEWRITTPSGKLKWLRGVGRPQIEAEGWMVWNTVVVDVSDSRRANESMRDSEARFRQLLSYVPNVSVQGYGIDMTTRYWNHASELLYGFTAEEAIGKNLLDLIIPPELREGVAKAVDVMIESGSPIPPADLSLLRKDGTTVDVFSSHAYLDIPGRDPEFYCIDFDLTERRESEAMRDLLQSQLRESQKMEALGTLAGGVAHDFNNIVAAIIGNVKLAMDDVPVDSPVYVCLTEIHKASRRARDLVQQILAFGRRQRLARNVIAMPPVVVDSVQLLRATLPAGLELRTQVGDNIPPVLADGSQISQVLLNLCTNAWHAIQAAGLAAGQGLVEVQLDAHHGKLPSSDHETWVRLIVRDNGHGMDEATQKRMFEPFFTTKAPGKGTGLGMSVVHGILRDHDAIMKIESAPGLGTTFTIYFPAAIGDSKPVVGNGVDSPASHGQGKVAAKKNIHILYVDDDEIITSLMERLLRREGYEVTGFADAFSALEAVRDDSMSFDLAITDYNMPGMSGLDFVRDARAQRPGLPVAITSGYISDDLRAQAPALGVTELIYKPNSVEELVAAVHRLAQEVIENAQKSG